MPVLFAAIAQRPVFVKVWEGKTALGHHSGIIETVISNECAISYMKQCSICGETKSLDSFYTKTNGKLISQL